jgi:hypothetical protein
MRYRPRLFEKETLTGIVAAGVLAAGIAGYFTAPWWAPALYLVWP